MPKARIFYTGPVRAISDARLSGLDQRVLHCVSLHDGMSLVKGIGRGCYATFATLTAEIGCDASNLSKTLKRLVEWDYLVEERQEDRRRRTYRVLFDTRDSWPNDQQSIVDDVGETANEPAEIVGNAEHENGSNPPQDERHYSSLKGLYLPKEKLNPFEKARFAARGLGRKSRVGDNDGAQLAIFERAWTANPNAFTDDELISKYEWLQQLTETTDQRDPTNQRAQRLYYAVDMALWETHRGPYAGEAA